MTLRKNKEAVDELHHKCSDDITESGDHISSEKDEQKQWPEEE